MHMQERPYISRILHMYIERILRMHILKNRYTHARISLLTHEFRLHTQEQVYIRRLDSAHAKANKEGCFLIFSKFSQQELDLNMFLSLLKC